ncbi:GNAT family N-acetyltransferase [Streptomyces sp. NPDC049954]|uniref:GNAT family N-acetyltransferase n=1 Tax=Streptomyces sp. NPDC049954 TaxID=3155779 RepID=UPI00342AB660
MKSGVPLPLTCARLTPDTFRTALPGLVDLLVATVRGGASLGFLDPFGPSEAEEWWRSRSPSLASGALWTWIATVEPGGDAPGGTVRPPVLGTVGLVPGDRPNGRHRAEITKLMVHPEARGRGLARRLLAGAETEAAAAGLRLLVLDTETGSPAERLYRSTGWTEAGSIPDYAADPAGNLRPTTLFHKRLTATPRR